MENSWGFSLGSRRSLGFTIEWASVWLLFGDQGISTEGVFFVLGSFFVFAMV